MKLNKRELNKEIKRLIRFINAMSEENYLNLGPDIKRLKELQEEKIRLN